MSPPFGLLNIHKPAGMTSRKVVDHVARLVRPAKAGHAGTLDPLATGVLVVCVGGATRLISFVQGQPKTYRAAFLLGRRSATDDIEGPLVEVADAPVVAREQIETLLPEFTGRIAQIPPTYSAVHVEGQRAYQLARQGKAVEIGPRTVEVYRIGLLALEYPELRLEIECGSGTYIRAIGRDLGDRLGGGAVMSELVRTRIGDFRLDEAVELESLTTDTLSAHLLPATAAVAHLPQVPCAECDLPALRHGRAIPCPAPPPAGSALVAVLAPDGALACLADYLPDTRQLAPRQVFVGTPGSS